jgi:glutaminyl-tRNA synthetase
MSTTVAGNFIRDIIDADLKAGKHEGRVVTRFPPEPNGYLHIGHAKSICLNFGIGRDYQGACHLRFDDTNPTREEQEYMDSIAADVKWLGFDWKDNLFHASDYFQKMYDYAVHLVKEGKAYVCDLTPDEMREYRGTLTAPGKDSPFRDRTAAENLELLEKMRKGEFPDGSRTLRAKIDMASGNINMRDPAIYRIRKVPHLKTGDAWNIYPMYDYAHCISDALEKITHSICTLEFELHRPLYDWILDQLPVPAHPQQIEFARLNLTYTVMSKRKLLGLVEGKHVSGWDDPRMPTIAGMRRRGYPPEAIREFCDRIGVGRRENWVELGLLEDCLRDNLNKHAPRALCVLRPLKVVLENWPEDKVDHLEAPYYPDQPDSPVRKIPFTRELLIERDDFMETPPKGFFRLAPGAEVRLRGGYFVRCKDVVKDAAGNVVELRCTVDEATRSGQSPDGRKVKGTIHWVSATHSVPVEVRLYDRLFTHEKPGEEGRDFLTEINPQSLEVLRDARAEPVIAKDEAARSWQFERLGYFFSDPVDSKPGKLVFNRTVSLKDSWAKQAKK